MSRGPGSFLELKREDMGLKNAVDGELVMRSTRQAARDPVEEFGYSVATLEPDFRDEKGEPDWTGIGRRAKELLPHGQCSSF